ncbi:MAG TPA: host attachment protein [Candidatus Kapabacteria bacterium]|nr:host attachment protein [Candidatus Kapabacteria bacterium]
MKHSNLIIATNLGTMKAFRISESSVAHRRQAELVQNTKYIAAHKKLSELVSDRPGRFRGSGVQTAPNRAFGENHNLKAHLKDNTIKQVTEDINALIEEAEDEHIYLAMPKAISHNINLHLSNRSKDRITQVHIGDIVKDPIEQIRAIFNV